MPVGFIGCGTMGGPMARNIRAAGYELLCSDRRDLSGTDLAEHARTVTQVAEECDPIFLMVRTADEIEDLVFSPGGLSERMRPGASLVICSTISLSAFRGIRSRLRDDIRLIDAPVSGAEPAARAGTLTFMVGADPDVFAHLVPLLRTMGRHLTNPGRSCSGMAVKILNNYVHIATVVTVRQAITWAEANGVDAVELRRTLCEGSASNWFLEHFDELPWSMENLDEENHIPILLKDCAAAKDLLTGTVSGNSFLPDALDKALRNV